MNKSKKKILQLGLASIALATLAISCTKEEPTPVETPTVEESEGEFVRLLVSDQNSSNYYLIHPEEETVETQAGDYSAGSLYTSPSGRYVAVVNTNDNSTSFFDSGIEEHGTHIHTKGTPKWALTKGNGSRPIHYYGRGDDMLVFNDGSGSISHFKESTLHTEATAREFNVGVAHHGAPALFNNGTIAVTEKDGSAEGTLPERVKIVDMDGNTLHTSTIQTGGIHGEAGNGDLVLFGSTDGILKVEKTGAQSLISYPSSFADNWLGAIYYGKESGVFVGLKSKYGLYQIDPSSNTISTIEKNSTIFSATWDWEGHHLIVLYTDGTLKVLDGHDFETISSKNVGLSFPSSGYVGNPSVAATEHFVYVSDGANAKLRMYNLETLDLAHEFSLPGNPNKIALMGSMLHEEGGH